MAMTNVEELLKVAGRAERYIEGQLPLSTIKARALRRIRDAGPEGITPAELATSLDYSAQALNFLINGLEEGGFIRRDRGSAASDKRLTVITVTDAGDMMASHADAVFAQAGAL